MIRYEILINENGLMPVEADDLEYMEGQIRYIIKYTDGVVEFDLKKVEDDVTI